MVPGELVTKRKKEVGGATWKLMSMSDDAGAELIQVKPGIAAANLDKMTLGAAEVFNEWKVTSIKMPTEVQGWSKWPKGSVWLWTELKADVELHML